MHCSELIFIFITSNKSLGYVTFYLVLFRLVSGCVSVQVHGASGGGEIAKARRSALGENGDERGRLVLLLLF